MGDYTALLARSLEDAGVQIILIAAGTRPARVTAMRDISRLRPDLVHLQYPSVGFGRTFWPHAIAMWARVHSPVVLTLHEFTAAHPARKLAMRALAGSSGRIVFTASSDRDAFGSMKKKPSAAFIPIGSNLPRAPSVRPEGRRVIYFGLIRPNRGLEHFLEVARLAIALGANYDFEVIGTADPRRLAYARDMRRKGAHVRWIAGLGPDEAAARIASSWAAYLPYPDGATERRGSLLAVLDNGVPVVTTSGPSTPSELIGSVLIANDGRSALAMLESLDGPNREQLIQRGRGYVERRSWAAIAAAHIELYKDVVEGADVTRGR